MKIPTPLLVGLAMLTGTGLTFLGCEVTTKSERAELQSLVEKKPPACKQTCEGCSYLTCSIMSARIRNKLASMPNCQFHPIFTALYSFHCAFFAGEPSKAQQEACTEAIADLTCGADGVVTLDDLPAACTTALGLPTEIRW